MQASMNALAASASSNIVCCHVPDASLIYVPWCNDSSLHQFPQPFGFAGIAFVVVGSHF